MKFKVVISGLWILLLFGCGDEAVSSPSLDSQNTTDLADTWTPGDTDEELDAEPETAEVTAPTAWTDAVEIVSFVDSGSIQGDTTDGASIGGAWGYQPGAGCWTLPEAAFYGGGSRFYAPSPVPGQNTKLTVTLSPEPGVDLNLSVLTMPLDEYWLPPEVELSSCYSSRAGGAGEPEEKKIFTITDVSNVLVMVVAPEGEAGGAFELSFLLEN